VRLVNGKDVLNRNNVLNNALNRNDVDVKSLRNFLNNSVNNNEEVIKNAFNNVAIGDVVAIDVLSKATWSATISTSARREQCILVGRRHEVPAALRTTDLVEE
jgi:hypothetical protein